MKTVRKFFRACEDGDLEEVKLLVHRLDNIDIKTDQGWTGLVKAVYNEHFDVVKLLVENGADVNATNHKGTTIFMYAKTPVFVSKNTEILSWLLNQGAKINAKDNEYLTVLDYVQMKEANWLVDWLIDQGAKYSIEL